MISLKPLLAIHVIFEHLSCLKLCAAIADKHLSFSQ